MSILPQDNAPVNPEEVMHGVTARNADRLERLTIVADADGYSASCPGDKTAAGCGGAP